MQLSLFRKRSTMLVATALLLGSAMAMQMFVSRADASGDVARLEALETQALALSGQIDAYNGALSAFSPVPPNPVGNIAPIIVAQSNRDVASINVRLGQLEEQVRVLTGQVEGLQFQMTQLQTYLERLNEDYEFRFQQLEGGGTGKTSAAPQSGSDTLAGGLPQNQEFVAPDLLIDPDAEGFALGSGEQPLGTLPEGALDLSGQPLDLTYDPGGLVTDADANAQYRAGYDAIVRGDYAFAEDQFRQFVGLFPEHEQAPDATNWLGEALILRRAYDEAADVLLTGYQSYSNSTRAPDLLLKLGTALAGAGEHDTACRTFSEVLRRYPDVSAAFHARLSEEISKAQC